MDTKAESSAEKDKYTIPSWASKAPQGTHLDVMKSDKLIQKLLIDEKGYYYFGRNPLTCDFVVEHASCSRVHAILLYHKILKRFAMVDLESSHGTFVEDVRIEPLIPVFLEFDNTFYFGASTRRYAIRSYVGLYDKSSSDDINQRTDSKAISLPIDEIDVDNLTEYHTAQNRRIPQIPISAEEARRKSRLRPKLRFNDEEDVINPEDVDPTVGRFRNLVRTAVIPTSQKATKRRLASTKLDADQSAELFEFYASDAKKSHAKSALSHQRPAGSSLGSPFLLKSTALGFGINAAPDLDLYANVPPPAAATKPVTGFGASATVSKSASAGRVSALAHVPEDEEDIHSAAHKKKYAKEAWPGRKLSSIV